MWLYHVATQRSTERDYLLSVDPPDGSVTHLFLENLCLLLCMYILLTAGVSNGAQTRLILMLQTISANLFAST